MTSENKIKFQDLEEVLLKKKRKDWKKGNIENGSSYSTQIRDFEVYLSGEHLQGGMIDDIQLAEGWIYTLSITRKGKEIFCNYGEEVEALYNKVDNKFESYKKRAENKLKKKELGELYNIINKGARK